jgi:outer membrane protein
MNRTLPFVLAMASAVAAPGLSAQAATAPAAGAAPATAPSAVPPQAVPAKIAIIDVQAVIVNSNEGQRAFGDINKKFEPQKSKIESEGAEVESLRKQVQALPANTSDEERANRLKVIDTKEKQLQRDSEDAQNAYNQDMNEVAGRLYQKVGQAAVKYAQDNGFTLMLNVGGNQQAQAVNPILWWQQGIDITQAVVNAYNASSGVAAPPPSAPAPTRRPTAPAASTPKK